MTTMETDAAKEGSCNSRKYRQYSEQDNPRLVVGCLRNIE